jgi:hypothetical protein
MNCICYFGTFEVLSPSPASSLNHILTNIEGQIFSARPETLNFHTVSLYCIQTQLLSH